ncbi:cAMP-binding domain of CRP or a regulatory subunit of cAMP-dependent protein kinases [Mameliella alba]|nr:CRP-like cAMP-binding protein [Mameliella alba]SDC77410.1 cAMP-binding domain of CRP or a regulatory subunit of cAMP-dependent protein kinases [Mameliella alba]
MRYRDLSNVALSQTPGAFLPKLDESLLTGLPPFSQLDRPQVRRILDHATSLRFDEGAAIFREGFDADHFYLLLDGHIRVVRSTEGGEQIIVLHVAPGQLFGIAKALQRETYPATAVAAAECIALRWPTRLWDGFTETYPGFASESYKTLGRRLGEIQETLTEMATKAVEQRVAAALLRMLNQSGRKTEEGIEIAFPVTRQNISDMTGTTLHTVSRLLSGWQKDGIVKSTRKHVVVTDPHRLVMLSGTGGSALRS